MNKPRHIRTTILKKSPLKLGQCIRALLVCSMMVDGTRIFWKLGARDAWHPATIWRILHNQALSPVPTGVWNVLLDSHIGKIFFIVFWTWILAVLHIHAKYFLRSFNMHWFFQKCSYQVKKGRLYFVLPGSLPRMALRFSKSWRGIGVVHVHNCHIHSDSTRWFEHPTALANLLV